MKRRSLSTKARVEFFLSRKGECAGCGMKCDRGWELDHVVALALGGDDEPSNWQVLCLPCHRAKSRGADVPAIARAKRRQAKHVLGIRKPSSFKGWKRFDGTPVRNPRA